MFMMNAITAAVMAAATNNVVTAPAYDVVTDPNQSQFTPNEFTISGRDATYSITGSEDSTDAYLGFRDSTVFSSITGTRVYEFQIKEFTGGTLYLYPIIWGSAFEGKYFNGQWTFRFYNGDTNQWEQIASFAAATPHSVALAVKEATAEIQVYHNGSPVNGAVGIDRDVVGQDLIWPGFWWDFWDENLNAYVTEGTGTFRIPAHVSQYAHEYLGMSAADGSLFPPAPITCAYPLDATAQEIYDNWEVQKLTPTSADEQSFEATLQAGLSTAQWYDAGAAGAYAETPDVVEIDLVDAGVQALYELSVSSLPMHVDDVSSSDRDFYMEVYVADSTWALTTGIKLYKENATGNFTIAGPGLDPATAYDGSPMAMVYDASNRQIYLRHAGIDYKAGNITVPAGVTGIRIFATVRNAPNLPAVFDGEKISFRIETNGANYTAAYAAGTKDACGQEIPGA